MITLEQTQKNSSRKIMSVYLLTAVHCMVFFGAVLSMAGSETDLLPLAAGTSLVALYPILCKGQKMTDRCGAILFGILILWILLGWSSWSNGGKILLNRIFASSADRQKYLYEMYDVKESGLMLFVGVTSAIVAGISGWMVSRTRMFSGILLPLGYGQGPGQAFNWGLTFENSYGFVNGSSFGLTVAAMGFVSASVGGVLYMNVMQKKGKLKMHAYGAYQVFQAEGHDTIAEVEHAAAAEEIKPTPPPARVSISSARSRTGSISSPARSPTSASASAGQAFTISTSIVCAIRISPCSASPRPPRTTSWRVLAIRTTRRR